MEKRIKELRTKFGLSLRELADQIGVSESTMQRYETGSISELKYEVAVQLADIFGVSPQYLLGWPDEDAVLDDANKAKTLAEILDPNCKMSQEWKMILIYKCLDKKGRDKVMEYAKLLAKEKL